MQEKIQIFDTTLRDGEQVPGCQLCTSEKIEIALSLEEMGVDVIESGFPISSPGDFKSVQEIAKTLQRATICALSRAKKEDIDCAAEALKPAKNKRIHLGIGASDVHIAKKFFSTREKVLEQAVWAVEYGKTLVEDIEFYAEDAGRADKQFLATMVEAVIKAGATVVNIPDTTGYCLPGGYGDIIKYLYENVKGIDKVTIAVHCHNDLGMATANTLAGIMNGARQVEVTMNGIGERAGNTSLEEIAMILKVHKDLHMDSGLDTTKIFPLSQRIAQLMNMPVQANKAIVGSNAFAHSSGIHQDGFLKHPENYEIINPLDVGIPVSSILLTARSGRAALRHRIENLGFSFDKNQMDGIYDRFLCLADQKRMVEDEDLLELISNR